MAERRRLSKSKAGRERIDAERCPKRKDGRDAERASASDGQNRDGGGHAHGSRPGTHGPVKPIQNSQRPVTQELSTAQATPELPSPSYHSESSPVPGIQSRLTRPFSPHLYTFTGQPRQPSSRTPSRSRTPQAPVELPASSLSHARDSERNRPRAPTAQHLFRPTPITVPQSARPFNEVPITDPVSRQGRHTYAPSKHVRFASPPHSEILPSEDRLKQEAENARPFSSQDRQPQRERSLSSILEPRMRRAYTQAPGSRWEDRVDTERWC